MVMMLRVGPGNSYLKDVFPALLLIGAGTVTMAAPLTVTPLSSVDAGNAGVASGINNATARASGPVAVAALALIVGMGPDAYRSGAAFDAPFGLTMPLCAALMCGGALVAFVTLGPTGTVPQLVHWGTHGWLMEPPRAPRLPNPHPHPHC
ncbi:hypothetical protein ACIOZL_17340 [Streptomyces sp. NPDC087769]|uniref:hypothetical protein n=1 Tax=Streptomyces sp. NPDC087769 TaxID=3365802 RepID=UPI00381A5079